MTQSNDFIPPYIITPNHIKHLQALPSFDPSLLTVDLLRHGFNAPVGDLPKVDISIEQLEVPGKEGVISVDVYRPKNIASDVVLPILIYLPGGGWCLPPQNMHPFTASKLAIEGQCTVLFINYLLSPEVKFPVALEQCFSVLTWILDTENAKKLHVDPSRIAVAGDSAGGNLTAALTILAKQKNLGHVIKRQLLFYPVLDAIWSTESYKEHGKKEYFSSLATVQLFWNNYKANDVDAENPLACPLRSDVESLRGLPPTFVVTSHVDVLRDEGEEFARKLMLADVLVSSLRVMHAMHGFLSVYSLLCEETFNVIDVSAGILRRTFNQ